MHGIQFPNIFQILQTDTREEQNFFFNIQMHYFEYKFKLFSFFTYLIFILSKIRNFGSWCCLKSLLFILQNSHI